MELEAWLGRPLPVASYNTFVFDSGLPACAQLPFGEVDEMKSYEVKAMLRWWDQGGMLNGGEVPRLRPAVPR